MHSISSTRSLCQQVKKNVLPMQEKLQVLLRTFGEGPNAEVDSVELNSEWEGMRRLIHTQYSSFTLRQMLRLLCSNQTLRDMFPNLTKLSTIAALIPVSIAE